MCHLYAIDSTAAISLSTYSLGLSSFWWMCRVLSCRRNQDIRKDSPSHSPQKHACLCAISKYCTIGNVFWKNCVQKLKQLDFVSGKLDPTYVNHNWADWKSTNRIRTTSFKTLLLLLPMILLIQISLQCRE